MSKYEIIITDDHSTDNTVQIASKFAAQQAGNSIIVLAHEKKHVSIAQNRNAGAHAAHGDYLVFMDSDCIVQNIDTTLNRLVALFESRPKLVAVTGKIGVIGEVETLGDVMVYSIFNFVHMIKNNILHVGEASGKFQMMSKKAFDKVGGYREDLITREDGDMFIRLSKIGRTYYDADVIVRHTGRRAHQIGWPKLLTIWMLETFWVMVFNKSLSKTWKAIR